MKRIRVASLTLLACIIAAPLFATIDLTSRDIYIRRGFDLSWINTLPQGDDWKRFPPQRGRRFLSVAESGLPGLPKRSFLSLASHPAEIFTIIIPLPLASDDLAIGNHLAVYLSYLGGSWQLFINGTPLAQEWHDTPDGRPSRITNIRNILQPLDARMLREGINIVAIKLRGDPTYITTGLYQADSYLVGPLPTLLDLQSETVSLVLIAIYLFFGLYHLFLFLLRRDDLHNLFFSLFSIDYFLYQLTRTRVMYTLIDDVNIIDRMELIFLFLMLPLVSCFINYAQDRRITTADKVLGAFFGILAISVIPTPLPFTYDIQMIWQYSLFFVFAYILWNISRRLAGLIRENYRQSSGSSVRRALRSIVRSLSTTVTGKLFFGVFIMVACGVFDNIDGLYLHLYLNLTRFAFLILIFGIALVLAGNFIFVHREVASLNDSLERKLIDLQAANRAVTQSEEKYRILVEGSHAAIFTITSDGRLLTANNTLIREQQLDPERLTDTNITDFLDREQGGTQVVEQLLKEKIAECIASKGMRSLKVTVKSPQFYESREMLLRLEYIQSQGGDEILCRATPVVRDALLQFLIAEQQTFAIPNHLTVAEELTQRLVRNVERYMDPTRITLLRLALREILLNAIEHGNLEISFNEKTQVTTDGDYLQYLAERCDHPEFRDRRVTIDYRLDDTSVTYSISDEGSGFDHRRFIDMHLNRANDELLAHGRGLVMALNVFDRMEYNKEGNAVHLVKLFKDPDDSPGDHTMAMRKP